MGLDHCPPAWMSMACLPGEMKLGDFGLARIFGSPDSKYTNQVTRSASGLSLSLLSARLEARTP